VFEIIQNYELTINNSCLNIIHIEYEDSAVFVVVKRDVFKIEFM